MSREMRQDRMPIYTVNRVFAMKCKCKRCGIGFSSKRGIDENGLCYMCRSKETENERLG